MNKNKQLNVLSILNDEMNKIREIFGFHDDTEAKPIYSAIATAVMMDGIDLDDAGNILPALPCFSKFSEEEIKSIAEKLHMMYGDGVYDIAPPEPKEISISFLSLIGADEVKTLFHEIIRCSRKNEETFHIVNSINAVNRAIHLATISDEEKNGLVAILRDFFMENPQEISLALYAASEHPLPILEVLTEAFNAKYCSMHELFEDDLKALVQIADTTRGKNPQLLRLSVKASELLARAYSKPVSSCTKEDLRKGALFHGMLSSDQSRLGLYEQALKTRMNSVRYFSELTARDRGHFLEHLGWDYLLIAFYHSMIGNWYEGLEASMRAVRFAYECCTEEDDNLLVVGLNDSGFHLNKLGKHSEALEASSEAVRLTRLGIERDYDDTSSLASYLDTLQEILASMSRHDEALQATQEALSYTRDLIKEGDYAELPVHILLLNGAAIHLFNLNRLDEAMEAVEEAISLNKEYYEIIPEAHGVDLATSYLRKGKILAKRAESGEEEQLEGAIESYTEAARILKNLFEKAPRTHDSLMSEIITNAMQACYSVGVQPNNEILAVQSLYSSWKAEHQKAQNEPKSDVSLSDIVSLPPKRPIRYLHPSFMLSPESRAVRFMGRERELADIACWLRQGSRFSIRFYAGEEGVGKTRLLMEACEIAIERGWVAGFIEPEVLKTISITDLIKLFSQEEKYLLVLDDAPLNKDCIDRLIAAFSTACEELPEMRIAILSREEELLGECRFVAKHFSFLTPHFDEENARIISPFEGSSDSERIALFSQAIDDYCRLLRKPASYAEILKNIRLDEDFETSFQICVTALALVHGQHPEALYPSQIFDTLAELEIRSILDGFEGNDDPASRRLLAIALMAITEGLCEEDAKKVLAQNLTFEDIKNDLDSFLSSYKQIYSIQKFMDNEYGQIVLASIKPIELARSFVKALGAEIVQGLITALIQLYEENNSFTPLETQFRLIAQFVEQEQEEKDKYAGFTRLLENLLREYPGFLTQLAPVAVEYPEVLETIMEDALKFTLEKAEQPENFRVLLMLLSDSLLEAGNKLLSLQLLALKHLLKLQKTVLREDDEDSLFEYATTCNNLGIAHSKMGQERAGLNSALDCLVYTRKLVVNFGEEYLPYLGQCLKNLSGRYFDLQMFEESRETLQESIDIFRQILEEDRSVLTILAANLNNMGLLQSLIDEPGSGLHYLLEAVEYRRELLENEGEAYLPELALALDNLANEYASLDRHEEAVSITKESVEYKRKIAQYDPENGLETLVIGLLNLNKHYKELKQYDEAEKLIDEALEHSKTLIEINSDDGDLCLARSLAEKARLQKIRAEESQEKIPKSVFEYLIEAAKLFYPFLMNNIKGFKDEYCDLIEDTRAAGEKLDIDFPEDFTQLDFPLYIFENTEEAIEGAEGSLEDMQNEPGFSEDYTRELAEQYYAAGNTFYIASLAFNEALLEKALAAFTEGARVLFPLFENYPCKHNSRLNSLLHSAMKMCEELAIEPSAELLEMLQTLFDWYKDQQSA